MPKALVRTSSVYPVLIGLSRRIRVFAYTHPVDMRKQYDGLYALVVSPPMPIRIGWSAAAKNARATKPPSRGSTSTAERNPFREVRR